MQRPDANSSHRNDGKIKGGLYEWLFNERASKRAHGTNT